MKNSDAGSLTTPPDDQEMLLYTINDILLDRVRSSPNQPLVGYPRSSHGLSDYVYYTATDLGRFTSGAVEALETAGLLKARLGDIPAL
jgi:hypothetical protein